MTSRRGSIGPAIIVASVVMGPGSILASSRVGCDFEYGLVWVVVLTAGLMIGMTALAAHVGVTLPDTPCDRVAARLGRAPAVLVGLVLFGVVACFQFSNNVAVVAALEPYLGTDGGWPYLVLGVLNLGILAVLFGLRRLYPPVEVLMKALVGLMMLGFLGNLFFATPSVGELVAGLVPSLPAALDGSLLPSRGSDPWLPVQALVGTTFSVAGAFYQAYLVREKGWTRDDLGRGRLDSFVGISVLALLTLTIMATAAATLHGRISGSELTSAVAVGDQLVPLFGEWARLLFSVGLLAGAFSSFLVNVMIGGTVMSDGLGLGARMDDRWPKLFTALALLVGMGVALLVLQGSSTLKLVLVAQSLTVVGNPVLALVLLWLARSARTPAWMQVLALLGFALTLVLAVRTGFSVFLRWT